MKKGITFLLFLSFLTVLFFGGGAINSPPVSAQEDGQNNKINSLLSLQVKTKLRLMEAAPAAREQAQ